MFGGFLNNSNGKVVKKPQLVVHSNHSHNFKPQDVKQMQVSKSTFAKCITCSVDIHSSKTLFKSLNEIKISITRTVKYDL